MNRTFIISDTHFGHTNICTYEPAHRPFATIQEHDDELVRRWNDAVRPNDTVWHLGDVLFGDDSFRTLGRLNGVKRLVMGNHDHHPISRYAEHFATIVGVAFMRGCIFTHVPIHQSQFYRFRANIHGHLHSQVIDDRRYVNVSAEQINLTPILLDKVLAKLPEIQHAQE